MGFNRDLSPSLVNSIDSEGFCRTYKQTFQRCYGMNIATTRIFKARAGLRYNYNSKRFMVATFLIRSEIEEQMVIENKPYTFIIMGMIGC